MIAGSKFVMTESIHNLFDEGKLYVCGDRRKDAINFLFMSDEETIFDRLLSVLSEQGISPLAFQKEMGIKSQYWTHWRARAVPQKWIFPVSERLNIYSDWLATGKGPKYKTATLPAPVSVKPLISSDDGFLPVRHVALTVRAGILGFAVDYIDDWKSPLFFREDWFIDNGYKPDKLLAVSVAGESMWPKLSPGDVVIINTISTSPIDGKVFVVNYEGEVVIKRLLRDAGQWWLSSDNPDKQRFPNKLCAGDYCLMIGEVVYFQSTSI